MKQERDPKYQEVHKELKRLVLAEMKHLRENGHPLKGIRSTAISLVSARCSRAFAELGRTRDADLVAAETEQAPQEVSSGGVVQGAFAHTA